MSGREVWVTGIGALSAAGFGACRLGEMLVEGRTGVRSDRDLGCLPAGRAPTPPLTRAARKLDRSSRFFLAVGEEAWRDAGLVGAPLDPPRAGVIEGSSLGPMSDLLTEYESRLDQGPASRVRPSRLTRMMTGAGGAALAQSLGLRGPVFHVSAGSVSGMCAIGEAFLKIESGRADVMIAGGAECPLHPEVVRTFWSAGILAVPVADEVPCRPFDVDRRGTVLGEGGAALVLEAAEHAKKRGARPRAIIRGFGLSCEAFGMTAPDPRGSGVVEAAREALVGVGVESVGWVKTHGTGTLVNDAAECRGLAALFGDLLPHVPITAMKPAVGHALGASGAVEAVASVVLLGWGLVPPTLGLRRFDPDLPPCRVATSPLVCRDRPALLLSESFGGRCAALTLQGVEGRATAEA